MNMIYVYCGDFAWCPHNVEILGDITLTDAQMSTIGKTLRPYHHGNEIRRVFTNSDNIITGIRLAVKRGHLKHNQIVFQYFIGKASNQINLDVDGNFVNYVDGFFTQKSQDLLELF